jgi:DNA modification methylase
MNVCELKGSLSSLGLRSAQMDLFAPLLKTYAAADSLSNADLLSRLSATQGLPADHWSQRMPIGKSGELHSPARRHIRWYQQTLKSLGLIERVPDQRGVWQATAKLRSAKELTIALPHLAMLGFSTRLGVALWADCASVFTRIDEPIHLCLTSPPYPLARARAYGGPAQSEYTEFICRLLEPIVKHMVPGGSLALNISNDCFLAGSPARSLYREYLSIALFERLGLFKMDTLIWHDPTKAPGPVAWASKERSQLNVAFEPVLWFTTDPTRVRSDNRRVLQPHTIAQQKLIARGGETRTASYGDGANRMNPGAFANPTLGKIPRNVLQFAHKCPSQAALRKELKSRGLPMHGATMPLALASFLVQFLSEKEDLVVDPCGGWNTTALAAQNNDRRWLTTEKMLEYVQGGQFRFTTQPEFESHLPAPEVM